MNIIIGMISPETNCAPKPASNSASFSAANRASLSRRRPNTFVNSCPVNASSTCALRAPVRRHCDTNSACERFMTRPASAMLTGIVTKAIDARTGERQTIIPTTPITMSSEPRS